jgi:hypothetical protein
VCGWVGIPAATVMLATPFVVPSVLVRLLASWYDREPEEA